jgi:hypothetical protein
MPTAAMEHSATTYKRYAACAPSGMSAAAQRKMKEREEIEKDRETRESLVARSRALTELADHMAKQNEEMLAGLRSLSHMPRVSEPVDYIARNVANVGPSRSTMDRKQHALLAHAEVMAAATAHLGGGPAPPLQARLQQPIPTRARPGAPGSRLRIESEEDLVHAALAEMEHGATLSAFESKTRRAPPRSRAL